VKLSAPDDLSAKERAAFDALAKHFPPGGVCVNVMVGSEAWDVRPLLLVNGTVVMYRLSRALAFDMLRHVAAELEGFSLLPGWNTSVRLIPANDKLLLTRPFVQMTLQDHLASTTSVVVSDPITVARKLITQVQELDQRGLVHGHITPANVAVAATSAEGLFLLDPRIGALLGRTDSSVAPEIQPMQDPPRSTDIYGLGCCLKAIMRGTASAVQTEVIERALLASPRQRPDLATIAAAFSSTASILTLSGASAGGSRGKIIVASAPLGAPQIDLSEAQTGANQLASEPSNTSSIVEWGQGFRRLAPSRRTLITLGLGSVAFLSLLAWRFPKVYNELAYYVPVLAAQSNPDYIAALASGDRARIRSVARMAVVNRDPAAINAILEDVRSGASRQGMNSSIAKVCYREPWIEEFSRSDIRTIVALTVAPGLPESLTDLAPLSSLHPAIIVAIAAQLAPTVGDARLKAISLTRMSSLGDPEGQAFEKLRTLGVSSMAEPAAIAIAQLIAGNATTAAYDALIGSVSEVAPTLERLAVALPLVMANSALADQLLVAMRDRGGDLGNVLSWFDIDDLVGWGRVPSAARLLLLLQQVPSAALSVSHYADLLKFPLPLVRQKAAAELKSRFLREGDGALLLLLSSEQNRLTREQTVALVSGLTLEQQKRAPFIALWFQMQPPADTVLLVLLGRATVGGEDLFNLEAARYLKKSSWHSSSEVLKLLVQHPEPLARTLAYAKLDPSNPEHRTILKGRISAETDKSLMKLVTTKLSPGATLSEPLPEPPPVEGKK
jgi:hypothetical protein